VVLFVIMAIALTGFIPRVLFAIRAAVLIALARHLSLGWLRPLTIAQSNTGAAAVLVDEFDAAAPT
jgi:hypothetical protein